MPSLNLTDYHENIRQNEVAPSLRALKTLYEFTDQSVSKMAHKVETSPEDLWKETRLLEDQDRLISLATKTKCSDMEAISQKIDLLNTALLKEKTPKDFSLTDLLIRSIWEDCQIHL